MSSPVAGACAAGDPVDGAALLERAVGYTRTSLEIVAGSRLDARTPCQAWDLRALLQHVHDGLVALTAAAETGCVGLVPVPDWPGPERAGPLVDRLRSRACALLGAWASVRVGGAGVVVAGTPVASGLVAAAGAVEVAVHGWDVARSCGADRPLPSGLADELLTLLPLLVTAADRPGRFAAPITVPSHASPGSRLLAALGRAGG